MEKESKGDHLQSVHAGECELHDARFQILIPTLPIQPRRAVTDNLIKIRIGAFKARPLIDAVYIQAAIIESITKLPCSSQSETAHGCVNLVAPLLAGHLCKRLNGVSRLISEADVRVRIDR